MSNTQRIATMAPRQLPLELPFSSATARDDLIVSPANIQAVNLIDSWPDWPAHAVILHGPVGTGKSHMARIWAEQADALMMNGARLADWKPGNDGGYCFVVEDIARNVVMDEVLFHLLNHARAHGGHCLMTSREPPSDWGVQLPDLQSRLRAATLVEISAPDDTLLRQVIVKLFADRQLAVDPGVVDYLVTRMERSLGAAGALVAEIDHEALARRSAVTRSLASLALQKTGMV
ncbi:MAG: hypothetical protein R3D32_12305 [Nitratireductor sp.]